jgi:hypothetical protein
MQPQPQTGSPEQLDVAWFAEEGQKYPLMIFEVESRVTNAAPNNPLKVYSKSSEAFEKPLFFFHIFLAVPSDRQKIENLLAEFGRHNYRVYTQENATQFIADVLHQHRRIRAGLNFGAFLTTLLTPAWPGLDLVAVVGLMEDLSFHNAADILPAYATLVLSSRRSLVSEVARQLRARLSSGTLEHTTDSWDSYLGQSWAYPVYLGILASLSPGPDSIDCLKRLQQWQGTDACRPMGPAFPDRDHTEFVVGASPSLWALLAALFRQTPGAVKYVSEQMRDTLVSLDGWRPEHTFHAALWLLHVASLADGAAAEFEAARERINADGGVALGWLLEPPGAISIEGDFEWIGDRGHDRVQVPDRGTFRALVHRSVEQPPPVSQTVVEFALSNLVRDQLYDWAPGLVRHLHGEPGSP